MQLVTLFLVGVEKRQINYTTWPSYSPEFGKLLYYLGSSATYQQLANKLKRYGVPHCTRSTCCLSRAKDYGID